MDEGNQLLLSITVLMQEEKELGHEKRENKRNSSKILSPDWKKKKKKKKMRTKTKFHFLIFVREHKSILYVHFGACCNLVRYTFGE